MKSKEVIKTNPNWSLAILIICAVAGITQTQFARSAEINGTIVSGLISGQRGMRLSYVCGKKIENYANRYLSEEQIIEVGFKPTKSRLIKEQIRQLAELSRNHDAGLSTIVYYGDTPIMVDNDCIWDLGLYEAQSINIALLTEILDWREENEKISRKV